MIGTADHPAVQRDTTIKTWIGVGGHADVLACPKNTHDLCQLVEQHKSEPLRVLGDGANLLVDDAGVEGIVLSTRELTEIQRLEPTFWSIGAGVRLPKLVIECARAGLSGIEGLAGVPASVGGAVRMNAGGRFGQIADVIESITVLHPATGAIETIDREHIEFGYRTSGISSAIVISAHMRFDECEPEVVRRNTKEVMARKKTTQPLASQSAGCAFKNPTVQGQRVSAGQIIDECGCKGMRAGGASVSHSHGNFVVTNPDATASDVIELLERVASRVFDRRGIELEREIVFWKRGQNDG
jgi:UDP-N-acetylmuramate dehydrogenase